jgi:hypothetical protein
MSVMFDRCLGNDFESVAALWMCAKRFKTLNICTTAVLWLIWKLRHSLCFQGNQWCGMQAVFYRCAKLTRRWGVIQSEDVASQLDSVVKMWEAR